MFKLVEVWHGLSHDPMDNNVEKDIIKFSDNCQDFWRIAVLERRGNMKLLSADDMREFINQRKPTTPEELKEGINY